jgi:hypothetical protein
LESAIAIANATGTTRRSDTRPTATARRLHLRADKQARARRADADDDRTDERDRRVVAVEGGEREHPDEGHRYQAEEADDRAAPAEPALA